MTSDFNPPSRLGTTKNLDGLGDILAQAEPPLG